MSNNDYNINVSRIGYVPVIDRSYKPFVNKLVSKVLGTDEDNTTYTSIISDIITNAENLQHYLKDKYYLATGIPQIDLTASTLSTVLNMYSDIKENKKYNLINDDLIKTIQIYRNNGMEFISLDKIIKIYLYTKSHLPTSVNIWKNIDTNKYEQILNNYDTKDILELDIDSKLTICRLYILINFMVYVLNQGFLPQIFTIFAYKKNRTYFFNLFKFDKNDTPTIATFLISLKILGIDNSKLLPIDAMIIDQTYNSVVSKINPNLEIPMQLSDNAYKSYTLLGMKFFASYLENYLKIKKRKYFMDKLNEIIDNDSKRETVINELKLLYVQMDKNPSIYNEKEYNYLIENIIENTSNNNIDKLLDKIDKDNKVLINKRKPEKIFIGKQDGGKYYHKYLKYKQKYINLKNLK